MPIASLHRDRANTGDRRADDDRDGPSRGRTPRRRRGIPYAVVALVVAIGLPPVLSAGGQGQGVATPVVAAGVEIAAVDLAGDPIGGGCFGLVGPAAYEPVCDDGDLDGDPRLGVVLIVGIEIGTYVVRDVMPPRDFEAAAAVLAEVVAGQVAATTLVHRAAAAPVPIPRPLPVGVSADRLVEETLGWQNLPVTIDTPVLARVTLPPGIEVLTGNGAHLFFVEAGTFTLPEYARAYLPPTGTPGPVHEEVPAGPAATFGAGDRFAVAARGASPPAITNEGEAPALALVVSIGQTGEITIDRLLGGGAIVEPLAVEDAARVGSPLPMAGLLGADEIIVTLDRIHYDRQAARDVVWDKPAARLIVVDTGALNVLAIDQALYRRPASGPPPTGSPARSTSTPGDQARSPAPVSPGVGDSQMLGATSRVSPVPGDQLLVPLPDRIGTRNVWRGPSEVLIVTVAPAAEDG